MGRIIIQKIYTCDVCGRTPDNGENMWHMCSEVWCEECCDKDEQETEDELSLYKQALTKSIASPEGYLPNTDQYYTWSNNGNIVVERKKR